MKEITRLLGHYLTLKGSAGADSTVTILEKDSSNNITRARCTTVPSATAGYAVGCMLIRTSTGHIYVNTGSATSCTFDDVGAISSSEIDANAITPIKMGIRTEVALADSAATPTIAQLMTSSIFTMTPTVARTFTTPTAALMVAGVTGATVGSWFDFTIVNNGTGIPITLTAGDASVTLSGDPVVMPGAATFRVRMDNVTAAAEALTIYRTDGLNGVTATTAELNYLDIATLGTGAASKAVVLDASGNYAMPATGNMGLGRAVIASAGTGLSSDAAVLTAQINVVTGADGTKAVALPAAGATAGPILVINDSNASTLPVFPVNGGNDNINALAEDAAFTMGPGRAAWFVPTSATQWYAEDTSAALPTTSELNLIDTAVAGTVVASKAAIYDAAGKLFRSSATPAAAGADLAGATALTAEFNIVTGATGANGVKLPTEAANQIVVVVNNDVTNSLLVYPSVVGSQINALGAGNAYSVTPGQVAIFVGRSASLWNVAAATDTITGLTASAAELNYNDTAVAGTSVASKTLVLGASKNTDILGLPVSGLKIGAAGAEVAVDASAAEMNLLKDAALANSVASKAAVLDASKRLRTNANVGSAGVGCTAVELGDGMNHTTIITVNQVDALTLADNAALADGYLIYTLPAGAVIVNSAYMTMAVTAAEDTTATADVGLGTTIGSGANATLNLVGGGAAENILTGQTASDCNGTATVKTVADQVLVIEAAGDHTVYFNVADTWADTAGADLTADIAGTVVLNWTFMA